MPGMTRYQAQRHPVVTVAALLIFGPYILAALALLAAFVVVMAIVAVTVDLVAGRR